MCCDCCLNRRDFTSVAAGLAAGMLTSSVGPASGAGPASDPQWDPERPLEVIGAKLKVQPVLMSIVQAPRRDQLPELGERPHGAGSRA